MGRSCTVSEINGGFANFPNPAYLTPPMKGRGLGIGTDTDTGLLVCSQKAKIQNWVLALVIQETGVI